MLGAAMAGHDDVLADAHGGDAAALDGAHAELAERMDQAQARGLVVGERKAAHHMALVRGEPDRARLGDEIADGEDQAIVADDDATAGAQRAEDLRGEGVFGDFGPQADDRIERVLEVKTPFFGPRPHLDRKSPFAFLLRHLRILDSFAAGRVE